MSSKRETLSRRTVLRGVGVSMALPWLEAMGPLKPAAALGAEATASGAAGAAPVRLACLFMPNGVRPDRWNPTGRGAGYELTPILEPMRAFKDDMLVLTHLEHAATDTGDGHYVKDAAFLTGTTITRTTGADLRSNGVSLDQRVAQQVGHLTALPSLELSIEPVNTGIDAAVGYTRLYGAHISWSAPDTPMARELNPKLAFDRLFRSGSGSRTVKQASDDRSVLDLVMEDARSLRERVGTADRRKLDEYLDSVRSVEKRIGFEAEGRRAQYLDDAAARAEIEKLGARIDAYHNDPGGARQRSADHTEHVQIMLDLMVMALWTDSTRVTTFMFGNSVSPKNFSFLEGVSGGHHQLSHHEKDDAKLDQYETINRWFMEQYAYMLGKMRSIKEGESTLLDNSMVLFGSGLRDGNAHSPHNLPIVVAGKAGGTLATGRHVVYPPATPLSNLYLSMLHRMGVEAERFADSTGPLAGLDDPTYGGVDVEVQTGWRRRREG